MYLSFLVGRWLSLAWSNLLLICLIINIFMNNFDLFINKTIIITERGCWMTCWDLTSKTIHGAGRSCDYLSSLWPACHISHPFIAQWLEYTTSNCPWKVAKVEGSYSNLVVIIIWIHNNSLNGVLWVFIALTTTIQYNPRNEGLGKAILFKCYLELHDEEVYFATAQSNNNYFRRVWHWTCHLYLVLINRFITHV